jgi:aspartyl-tRNA(Asn)/glutamyl-tRNA(Gln) amidotransferase subunit A
LLGEAMMVHCGETLPVRASLGLYTQPISFGGMPVVVVPVHCDGEMPAGVQIIAPRWREDRALGIAALARLHHRMKIGPRGTGRER